MKSFLLTTLNSKFSHSSLALHCLKNYKHNEDKHDLRIMEFTINQPLDLILREIFRSEREFIFFSCYIWNVEEIKKLMLSLKKMNPKLFIAIGGPEVSYDSRKFLAENPACDLVMSGEGEEVFSLVLDELEKDKWDFSAIPALTYRENGEIKQNPMTNQALAMEDLPFAYDDLADLPDKIIYYESSRGCPYRCAYCLSSLEKSLRFRPLEQVKADLDKFLALNLKQVKFIDRTFNAKASHAMAIWQYIAQKDNGITNFHFEITADILSREMLDFLKTVRPGLMQFEIGIQSTNPQTIQAINRHVSFEKLRPIVSELRENDNIHLHLDLIAGLPYEDYQSFGRSFDDVYSLRPHALQLGFLKVLKGTAIYQKCEEYQITYLPHAPYEVLSTAFLSAAEIIRLKGVEDVLEKYYNSGKFPYTMEYLLKDEPSVFAFYQALGDWWVEKGLHLLNHSTGGLADNLYRFCAETKRAEGEKLAYALKFDLCLHEKPKKIPACLADLPKDGAYVDFYRQSENLAKYLPLLDSSDGKGAAKLSQIAQFPYQGEMRRVLFDYSRRTYLGYAYFVLLPN